jgi:hypothetical protein
MRIRLAPYNTAPRYVNAAGVASDGFCLEISQLGDTTGTAGLGAPVTAQPCGGNAINERANQCVAACADVHTCMLFSIALTTTRTRA